MTRTIARALVACLLTGSAAAQSVDLLDGLSLRFFGGLDRMGGIDELNSSIRGMNDYFGPNGTWVVDAQGDILGDANWSPVLKIESLTNRPDLGLAVEKSILRSEHTRLTVGLEYAAGATSTSGEFAFTPPFSNLEGSVWSKERVEVSNFMLTGRYSLRDLNLPMLAHVGAGLGYGSIDTHGHFLAGSTVVMEEDPDLGDWAPYQIIDAEYDGNALTARLFVGMEVEVGPMSFLVDLGYNHMDFGDLEGSTRLQFRQQMGPNAGTFFDMEVDPATVPDTRYELAPLISASLQDVRDRAIFEAIYGVPAPVQPLDVGNPAAISYDLSGGYVRFSVGFRF
jgi:opacity protein-like surface antigen